MTPGNDIPGKETLFLKGKLTALSAILRLGHEAFEKDDIFHWASHIVNNSLIAIQYSRSALVDVRGSAPRVIAVSGQPEVKKDSEYCVELRSLISPFRNIEKITPLDGDALAGVNAGPDAVDAYGYMQKTAQSMFMVPVSEPGDRESEPADFIWFVEFDRKDQASMATAIFSLLKEHYGESLFYILNRKKTGLLHKLTSRHEWLSPSRIFLVLLLFFCILAFALRIRETVSAEFEIVPEQKIVGYAPFEGTVSKCFFKNGNPVEKGDEILKLDTKEMVFDLNSALNEFNRYSAMHELVQSESFKNPEKRGEVKLLALQREKVAIGIKRSRWHLDKSSIRAETEGILDIGDVNRLEGKAVRPGEKLFEILETENLAAEISLDERQASVIESDFQVSLYLHTRPESPLTGPILSVTPKPVLTERNTYCYLIKVALEEKKSGRLICGMRGVARVSGKKVSLAYYLFRHIILWFRQL